MFNSIFKVLCTPSVSYFYAPNWCTIGSLHFDLKIRNSRQYISRRSAQQSAEYRFLSTVHKWKACPFVSSKYVLHWKCNFHQSLCKFLTERCYQYFKELFKLVFGIKCWLSLFFSRQLCFFGYNPQKNHRFIQKRNGRVSSHRHWRSITLNYLGMTLTEPLMALFVVIIPVNWLHLITLLITSKIVIKKANMKHNGR